MSFPRNVSELIAVIQNSQEGKFGDYVLEEHKKPIILAEIEFMKSKKGDQIYSLPVEVQSISNHISMIFILFQKLEVLKKTEFDVGTPDDVYDAVYRYPNPNDQCGNGERNPLSIDWNKGRFESAVVELLNEAYR